MSSSTIKGMDDLNRQINHLKEKIESSCGEMPLNELLSSDFMKRFSSFDSCAEMLKESGYVIKSKDDLDVIPKSEWDAFINSNTQFSNWNDMLKEAATERVKTKLNMK